MLFNILRNHYKLNHINNYHLLLNGHIGNNGNLVVIGHILNVEDKK